MLTKNPALLAEREYDTNHKWFDANNVKVGWYAPEEFFNHFVSVINCDYWNTTSSAGDWSGYIVQKLNGWYYLIPFWQENRVWQGGGYTFGTGNILASRKGENISRDEIYEILEGAL